ncbi:stAR-related lipid transfer protein 3-like [Tigriopus californicus]|nr:stAR-related lipid transfer protein 3-like [Tigriopus californicus]
MAPKELSDDELLKIVNEAWDEAWEIVNSEDGWKEEKKSEQGDVVVSKKNKKGKKIYRVKAKMEIAPAKLIEHLKDTEKMCEWNTTLTEHKLLRKLNDKVAISYQVTAAGGPNGVVSARDFIFIFKNEYKGDAYVQGGCSVDIPGPKSSKVVRAWNGPGAQIVRPIPGKDNECEFIWLMDCEYKGWIPSSILDLAMPVAQLQFVDCVRKLAKDIKEGKK